MQVLWYNTIIENKNFKIVSSPYLLVLFAYNYVNVSFLMNISAKEMSVETFIESETVIQVIPFTKW